MWCGAINNMFRITFESISNERDRLHSTQVLNGRYVECILPIPSTCRNYIGPASDVVRIILFLSVLLSVSVGSC